MFLINPMQKSEAHFGSYAACPTAVLRGIWDDNSKGKQRTCPLAYLALEGTVLQFSSVQSLSHI